MGILKNIRNVFSRDKAQEEDTKIKSSGMSAYAASRIAGSGSYVNSNLAYWIWEKSDTVADSCNRISWAFQSIQPALRDKKTGALLTKPGDHPLLGLLESPGFDMDSSQLMFSLMTAFLVTGNCFPILTGNVKFEPIGIHAISANKANLISNGYETLQQITFSSTKDQNIYRRQIIPKRQTAVYQADNQLSETMQVLITKRKDGVDAQSPLERIYYQATTKYFGNMHNSSMVKNASRPGGLFSPKDTKGMSPEQYEAFKKEVSTKFSGPINTGRNIVSPIGVNYENFLLSTRDMDFINLIEESRTEIYNLYNIPLALVSEKSMTMSNFENSLTGLFDMAVLPRAKFVLKRVGEFALGRYKDGDRYELTYDEKTIPSLKARMLERAKAMREIYAFSEDEIRTVSGYEELADGTGEQIYKPANLILSGDEDDYTGDNIQSPGGRDEEEEIDDSVEE